MLKKSLTVIFATVFIAAPAFAQKEAMKMGEALGTVTKRAEPKKVPQQTKKIIEKPIMEKMQLKEKAK